MSGDSAEQSYEYGDRFNMDNNESGRRRYGSRSSTDGPHDYQTHRPGTSERPAENDYDNDDQRNNRYPRPRGESKKKNAWW